MKPADIEYRQLWRANIPAERLTDASGVRNAFRQFAKQLATGEIIGEHRVSYQGVQAMCSDDSFLDSFTLPYIRTLVSRVPEVRDTGRVKVSFDKEESEIVLSFTPGVSERKASAVDSAARIQGHTKALRDVRKFNPDITSLPDSPLDVAINVIEQYRSFIDEMLGD